MATGPSIEAEFGLNAGPFRRGIADVNRSLRRTEKQVITTQRAFSRLMGVMAMYTAVIAMIARVSRSALKVMDDMAETGNKNAQAFQRMTETVKSGVDAQDKAVGRMVVNAVGSLNRFGESLGDSIGELRMRFFEGMTAREATEARARIGRQEEAIRENEKTLRILEEGREERRRIREQALAELKRISEQERRLRDEIYLESLSDAERLEELQKRYAAARRMEGEIVGDDEQTAVQRAQLRLRAVELSRQILDLQGRIEDAATRTAEAAQRDREEQERKVRSLREQAQLAEQARQRTKEDLARARAERLMPTLAELAAAPTGATGTIEVEDPNSPTGTRRRSLRNIAREVERVEDQARRARMRGRTEQAEELESRAERLRGQLGGFVRRSEAEIFAELEERVKESNDYLEEIRDSLRIVEADAGNAKPAGSAA